MSGSRKTAGAGMGIPGPIVSLLKEISLLPGLNETSLPKKLYEAYVKKKFNLRSELAVGYELGRQAIPVILNEVLARSFYFIRRIGMEYKENGGFDKIEWKNTLPFKNRTIVRMMTISTGTFTVVDLADAAIRSAIKSGGVNPTFLSNFILRVNFVGVGRFAIACGTDVKMGTNKKKLRNERIAIFNEQLHLVNTKIFYKQAEMWVAAENAERTIQEAYDLMYKTTVFYIKSMQEIRDDMNKISSYIPAVKAKNPGLLQDIDDILTWG